MSYKGSSCGLYNRKHDCKNRITVILLPRSYPQSLEHCTQHFQHSGQPVYERMYTELMHILSRITRVWRWMGVGWGWGWGTNFNKGVIESVDSLSKYTERFWSKISNLHNSLSWIRSYGMYSYYIDTQELYNSIEKMRLTLFRMVSKLKQDEEGMAEILQTSDSSEWCIVHWDSVLVLEKGAFGTSILLSRTSCSDYIGLVYTHSPTTIACPVPDLSLLSVSICCLEAINCSYVVGEDFLCSHFLADHTTLPSQLSSVSTSWKTASARSIRSSQALTAKL